MKRFHPSPALVISLIALFLALGGTSYAAINALPKNSVGTKQLKNGAVSTAKLKAAVLKNYFHAGGTLPSGKTEVGTWGFSSNNGGSGGANGRAVVSFPVPLAAGLDDNHALYVSGASATHCAGVGHADPGYLCVYEGWTQNNTTPNDGNIFDPDDGSDGISARGWSIYLQSAGVGTWAVMGSYAVTAP